MSGWDGVGMNTQVVRVEMDLQMESTLEVKLQRLYGRYAVEPKVVDVPMDFRRALRKWLDNLDSGE